MQTSAVESNPIVESSLAESPSLAESSGDKWSLGAKIGFALLIIVLSAIIVGYYIWSWYYIVYNLFYEHTWTWNGASIAAVIGCIVVSIIAAIGGSIFAKRR